MNSRGLTVTTRAAGAGRPRGESATGLPRARGALAALLLVSASALLGAPALPAACEDGAREPRALAGPPEPAGPPRPAVFVAPDGRPKGKGTEKEPWDLQTALSQPSAVGPGTTVYLRGGVYQGTFTSDLVGAPGEPITVRPYQNERPIIDAWNPAATTFKRQAGLLIRGAWVIFRDLEIRSSDPRRVSPFPGSNPRLIPGWRDNGVDMRAPNSKLVNLVIHDTGQGIGFWETAVDSEVYGCIIYNNGWDGPDRGHGHGLYIQNEAGTKVVEDVISFNNFATGMKAYGQKAAAVGVTFRGVVSFNNGASYFKEKQIRNEGIFVGTTKFPPRDIAVLDCYLYQPPNVIGGGLRLGYTAENGNVVVRGNYLVCGGQNLWISRWSAVEVRDNVVVTTAAIGSNPVSTNVTFPVYLQRGEYRFDNNRYFDLSTQSADDGRSFFIEGEKGARGAPRLSFEAWRNAKGWDPHSTYTVGRPQGVDVFVRPNRYEPGRAHVVVYNWKGADHVDVDVSKVLKPGTSFEVRNAQDYLGEPVLRGVYDGRPLRLPLVGLSSAQPFAYDHRPAPTGPEFNAFVILPR